MRDEYPNLTFLSEQTVCTASGLYIYQTDGDSRVPQGEGSVRHRQGNCVLKKSFLSEKNWGTPGSASIPADAPRCTEKITERNLFLPDDDFAGQKTLV